MIRNLIGALILCCTFPPHAWTAEVDLSDKPLASGTGGEVKPNVMIVLDDSGSMSFSYLPDDAVKFHKKYGYVSNHCNGVYYDPSVIYTPPVFTDGSFYPAATFTSARDDGFDSSSATTNLDNAFVANRFSPESANSAYSGSSYKSYKNYSLGSTGAYYYIYTGSETKKDYVDKQSTFYKECSSKFDESPGNGVFTKRRLASTMNTTITVMGSGTTRVNSIQVNGVELMSGTSIASNSRNALAANIASKIANGYSATASGDVITITGPAGAARHTPIVQIQSGSMTFATDVFPETEPEKLTNFANWYSYYRVRLLAAKTAVGHALVSISEPSNYRMGYSTHSYTGWKTSNKSFQKIDDFCAGDPGCAQRDSIFNKLYGAGAGGGTPLRSALAKAGRIFAGKATDDPMQYSCQQNFLILTTDGYWNGDESAKFTIDNTAKVGNQDGAAARPMYDAVGSSDSLSDIAMYYYETDLRTAKLGNCTGTAVNGITFDVCENNVPGSGIDTATHQHMTTFTLGLGISGTLEYCENYDSGGCADFEKLKQGTKSWPDPTVKEDLKRVDDLWHAAVNGRGKYFSADSPESMSSGLRKALAGVAVRTASAAAAATSNLELVAGDNYAYVAMYTTVDWNGDITAREIDLSSGIVSNTVQWSAQTLLDAKVSSSSDTRTIYFNDDGALESFEADNLSAQIDNHYFDPNNPKGALTPYADLTAAEQEQATPNSIIGFLRGRTEHEEKSENEWKLYRERKHVLGDIIHGAPVYVRKPPFAYSDDGYSDFASNNEERRPVVYAGSNDGMLHAFDGDTGNELWAFVPTVVMPEMYKLADKNYDTNHRFYVDGPITVADFCPLSSCDASQWKTILVGALGKGGRAYYALDVTNPTSPKLLWEFSNDNLGYTYGNAAVTKYNGQWVVIVASGYNNVNPGDGKGRLFVLKADSGTKLAEIITSNSETDPGKSGIAKINNWVDETLIDNTTEDVYGGDLDGNVWRFGLASSTATKITTIGKSGAPTQPITTKPELAEVKIGGTPTRVILIGAGRYLGTSDIGSTELMSMYAIKDDLVSPPYGNFRTHSKAVSQDLSAGEGGRKISYTAMAADDIGWYMDLDVRNGERINVDPKFQVGWWVVPSNIPDPNVCNIGGSSWLYFIDPWPGKTRDADSAMIINVGNALIVGINVVKLPNGKIMTITTKSDATYGTYGNPMAPSIGEPRRLYWRELTR